MYWHKRSQPLPFFNRLGRPVLTRVWAIALALMLVMVMILVMVMTPVMVIGMVMWWNSVATARARVLGQQCFRNPICP